LRVFLFMFINRSMMKIDRLILVISYYKLLQEVVFMNQ
jgi:hypothetical protein